MSIYSCETCGAFWPAQPPREIGGSHRTRTGDPCEGAILPMPPAQHALMVKLWRAEAEREAAVKAAERLADRLTVAEGTIRQLSAASGRNLARYLEASRRASAVESALTAADSRPAQLARAALSVQRFLIELGSGDCPSCKIPEGHRPHCRLEAAVTRIDSALR